MELSGLCTNISVEVHAISNPTATKDMTPGIIKNEKLINNNEYFCQNISNYMPTKYRLSRNPFNK